MKITFRFLRKIHILFKVGFFVFPNCFVDVRTESFIIALYLRHLFYLYSIHLTDDSKIFNNNRRARETRIYSREVKDSLQHQ